ncbi:MAG: hypothetical protein ABR499_16540 [Gemmatimonadaceae bacterium]
MADSVDSQDTPSTWWQPDRLLRALLVWTSIVFLAAWLPLVRGAFDGPSYEWGTSYWGVPFSGAGVGGDYWLPVLKTALGLAILWLGWRGARPPFHWLLLAWNVVLTSDALYIAATRPGSLRFRGDTLGVDVSLAWVAPLLTGVFLALAVVWVVRDRRQKDTRSAPRWTRANTAWSVALLALLPIQFALLRFGPPNGAADKAGVLLTIAQWLLVGVALKPRLAKIG